MPTIGKLEFFFERLERDICRAELDRADFLRLDFIREPRAPPFGVRFAAMALFMLIAALSSDKLRLRRWNALLKMTTDEGRRNEQMTNVEEIRWPFFHHWDFVILSSFLIRVSSFVALRHNSQARC